MSESPLSAPPAADEPALVAVPDAEALAECMARHPAGKRRALNPDQAGGHD